MRAIKGIVSIACLGILLTGCAVGNKHSYQNVVSDIQASGFETVAVATQDQRVYVLSGNKDPDFVGIQRGGFGNPFDITTDSGNPLASDMTKSVTASFAQKGFKAKSVAVSPSDDLQSVVNNLKASGADRLVFVKLSEWKSDTLNNTALIYNLTAYVFDGSGKLLGQKTLEGRDNIGGSAWNPPAYAKKAVPVAFKQKTEQLFNSFELHPLLK